MKSMSIAKRTKSRAAIGLILVCISFLILGCQKKESETDGGSLLIDNGTDKCESPENNWAEVDLGDLAIIKDDVKSNFYSVWGIWDLTREVPEQGVYIVGSGGKVLMYDGVQYLDLNAPTDQTLTSVWGTSTTDVWAVGFDGLVLHYNGQGWEDRSPPLEVFFAEEETVPTGDAAVAARRNLWGVWANGPVGTTEMLYAVGDQGLVLQFTNGQWTGISSGVEENLNDVWGVNNDQIFIAGDFGTLLSGSSTLSAIETGISKPLQAVWGRGGGNVFTVGLNGTLLRLSGGNSESIDDAPLQFLRDIWGPRNDGSVYYIVGWDGTLLKMTDGTFEGYNCITKKRLEGIWGTLVDGPIPDAGIPDAGIPQVPAIWIVGVSGTVITGP